jgi:thiol-disulfide isomerase/thioredoxin
MFCFLGKNRDYKIVLKIINVIIKTTMDTTMDKKSDTKDSLLVEIKSKMDRKPDSESDYDSESGSDYDIVSTTDSSDTSKELSDDSDTELCPNGYTMGKKGVCCSKDQLSKMGASIPHRQNTSHPGLFINSSVTELTLNEFYTLYDKDFYTPEIILFYADWCHFCQEISGEYKKVAAQMTKNPNYRLYAFNVASILDAKQQETFTDTYNIPGYPYLVRITGKNVNHIVFDGERKVKAMLPWVKRHLHITTPAMIEHYGTKTHSRYHGHKDPVEKKSTKDIELIDPDPIDCFVMVYANWCGHCATTKPDYEQVAQSLPDKSFYMIDGDRDRRYKIEGFPTLFHVDKKGKRVDYAGQRDADSLIEWAKSY